MADTPKLDMPEIAENQASKYVTHNGALRILDALVQCNVKSRTTDDEPSGPVEGDTYIPASPSSGDPWDGLENKVVYYDGSAWEANTPAEGWIAYVQDENKLIVYNGSSWVDYPSLVKVSDLSDVPSFSGKGYQLLRITSGQSALETIENEFDVKIFVLGEPGAGDIIHREAMVRAIRFSDDFYLSRGNCETAPSDSSGVELTVEKNGVEFGQILFASGETSATFNTDSGIEDFAAGDVLKVVAPNPADPAFKNVGVTLRAIQI
jgi:hypothetical protein